MEFLCVGQIIKPQGIKGEVKIHPLVDIPAIFNGKHVLYIEKKECQLKNCTYRMGYAYASFVEIPDRNTAEKYRNKLIYMDKEEFYQIPSEKVLIDDIIGQVLFDENGELVGQIVGVQNYGFDDLILVKEDEVIFEVPFVKAVFIGKGNKMHVNRKEYEGAKVRQE